MHVSVSNGFSINGIGEQLGAVDIGLSIKASKFCASYLYTQTWHQFNELLHILGHYDKSNISILVISTLVPLHIGMTYKFGPTPKL